MKNKQVKTKASAIRAVVRDDLSLTNGQIKELVQARYGLAVESNQIHHLLGKEADRRFQGKAGQMQLDLAEKFVRKVGGDIRHAVRLCHLSQAK